MGDNSGETFRTVVVVVDGVVVVVVAAIVVADEGLRDIGQRIGHYASCVVVP